MTAYHDEDENELAAGKAMISDTQRSEFVLVPREPDWRMLVMVRAVDWPHPDIHGEFSDLKKETCASEIYHAMIAAAPTPPKVGSEEMDAAGLEAARRAMGTIPGAALWGRLPIAIRAYLEALAAPVDHPEVVGGMEGMVYAPNVMTALAAAHEAVRNAEREAERLRLALAKIADYSPDSRVQPALIARSALQPSDSPALEAGVAQYAVDRRTLEEAALDTSLSDGAVRALCVARVGKITDEVRQWAAALSIPAKESGK